MVAVRIPPGFARGESKAAVPGRYSHGNLVRWRENALAPVGGWERLTQNPFPTPARWGFVWLDEKFNHRTITICDGNVFIRRESLWSEITPADWKNAENAQTSRGYGSGNYGLKDYGQDDESRGEFGGNIASDNDRERVAFPVAFSAEKWGLGEVLFGTSGDGRVHVWKDGDAAPHVCANAPTLLQCFTVTEERHLMTGGGNGFPNRVAWSDQGNREGWDFTDVEGQAGYFDLADAGQIYCFRKIPGAVLIFTQTSVWVARYIGYPTFYGFTRLAEAVSPISPQSVVVGTNRAFWWGAGSFYKYEGGIVTPIFCELGLDPIDNLDKRFAPKRVTGGFNSIYNEVWWFYPSKNQNVDIPENDRYVIFHVTGGWWADGYLGRSFYVASPIDGAPLAGATTGHVYLHEQGWLAEGQTRVGTVWAQVDVLSFEDGDRLYSVTQMQVDTSAVYANPQNTRFEVDCRISRGASNLETERYFPRDDGYMDARFTARDFTMRVFGMFDEPWAVGALIFDVKPRGKR